MNPLPPGLADNTGFTEKWIYIYALIDPETDEVRYIGKSERPQERLTNHMNEKSQCHRSHWLQSLKRKGLRPHLVILEAGCGNYPWKAIERYWIAKAKRSGCPLTNNTDGGDGVSGLPAETRARIAATWKGRKHKPESIEKLKIARRKRKTSDATRLKMSMSQSGRKILWTDKIAEANRKLTPEQVAEIIQRLANGEGTCALAKEFGVHRTTISKVKMGTYHGSGRPSS